MSRSSRKMLLLAAASFATWPLGAARADTDPLQGVPTLSDYGGVGLIEMRNARFMPDGYLSAGTTIKAPDDRIDLTFQALPWMEATFRYTINYALPPQGQRALYDRSFDVKFRLLEEQGDLPAVALGFQDILGTGIYSGEYLVASKSYGPLDFTLGMGWGRLASRPAFENPLRLISSRFATRPGFSGNGGSPKTGDWFRGPNVGLFGGIEYRTPIENLTFKIEYSSDAYSAESSRISRTTGKTFDYSTFPVNVGVSYRLFSDTDLGVSFIGGREIAGTLSFSFDPEQPNFPQRLDESIAFKPRTEAEIENATRQQEIQSGQQGNESWRVHFVDLTAKNAAKVPSGTPADMVAAALAPLAPTPPNLVIADNLSGAIGEQWVQGHTLVAQVRPSAKATAGSLCAAVSTRAGAYPGVRDVAVVGADWNPIDFCAVASKTAEAKLPPDLQLVAFDQGQTLPNTETAALPDDAASPPASDIERMRAAVEAQQVVVEGIAIRDHIVEIEISNNHYRRDAEAVARTARALSASASPDISAFRITASVENMPMTTFTIPRTQIDGLGNNSVTPAELWFTTVIADSDPSTELPDGKPFPRFSYSIIPDIKPSFFDPDNPVYISLGPTLEASVDFFPGLELAGSASYSLYNNFGDIKRISNSVLPHVRTDIAQYLKKGASGVNDLTLSYYTKPFHNIYARATAGYIEEMYAGIGGEVLYRPDDARWALGADVWDVKPRNFNGLFGFRCLRTNPLSQTDEKCETHILTGHVTLYVETPWYNIDGQITVGRYLAGDYGGTFQLTRTFDTGVTIGAWMTLTNVSPARFGEGSFDKGILLKIPLEWVFPFGSKDAFVFPLRPIQRDGGQELDNARTLYDTTSSSSYGELERQWPDVFH